MKDNDKDGSRKADRNLLSNSGNNKDNNARYAVVKTNAKYASGNSFLSKILDEFALKNVEAGQLFVVKRSMKREHGEMGHDYAGMVVSPALIKDYYITRIKAWQSFFLGFITLALSVALVSYYVIDGSPVLFFNMGNYSGNVQDFLPSTIVILVGFNVFRILHIVAGAVNSTRWSKTQEFWASIAFLIADKSNKDTPFKDLLIKWDYIDENFVNDVAAESFDSYINSLNENDFTKIVKDGMTLSVIGDFEEDLIQHPVHVELMDEAQSNGNKIRQKILDNFNRDFKKL